MAQLRIGELNFYYGFTQILKGIDFSLEEGKIISIVGPSGGGKTTLLKLCAGLLDVVEGEIDNSFSSSAFAFQDPRLLPWKTSLENIMMPLHVKMKERELKEKATALALKFGLEKSDLLKYPKDLSGGMRQRVSFARALIGEPKLLFLDEPFSALDIGLKKELQSFVLEACEKRKMSVLFITHDLMEAIKLSDTILLLKSDPGEIVARYAIETPQEERDDAFVFEQTKGFLEDALIREIFEIKVNA
ncbi:ABC transporter ATP-binding protein [Sulfurospirillum sp. hDNRA2]|jgi:NitT/TauT family transport system ATP-binding protein|uniref:ABC transporter ATP-binding protein n=1 Tax=Sulfurospirillum sp. hDNRA2 TaxID=3237298 RepID=UPI0020B7109B|nr:ATP-binding cassette domain-containing protein [Sulfurospirillum sp. DNRA8]MCP3652723.1 ATP-binding cassette domain-containing protein [Sulfurospirillum sp. DNRA8]MCR1811575.1 ATP-binding cassette domain-containing protein [Sulfurospirillum sp. DNRA8]